MTAWAAPHHGFDAVSTATPLSYLKPAEGALTTAAAVAEKMGLASSHEVYLKLFLGDHAGCIGESSAVLILIGFVYLLFNKVIEWHIPVSMVVTTVLVNMLAGIDPLLTLLSGGLLFGAVFMATDYATSPVTLKGQIIFGIGCGLITALMRLFAGMPEGVMYSILIMNSVVTFLNRLLPRKYGYVKPPRKTKPAKEGA